MQTGLVNLPPQLQLWKLPHCNAACTRDRGALSLHRFVCFAAIVSSALFTSLPVYTCVMAATVSDRIRQFGAEARERLQAYFAQARVAYPPAELKLVGLKRDARLEAYARSAHGDWRFVRSYPILAASGESGPKLRAGDGQVPEGLYRVELLNPNSRFHVSLRLNYPNAFDRRMAAADGRTALGGDIMIHGSNVSIGCLAMGDPVAEELFTLAADTRLDHVDVILAPNDLRHGRPAVMRDGPRWIGALYDEIAAALAQLPIPDR